MTSGPSPVFFCRGAPLDERCIRQSACQRRRSAVVRAHHRAIAARRAGFCFTHESWGQESDAPDCPGAPIRSDQTRDESGFYGMNLVMKYMRRTCFNDEKFVNKGLKMLPA
ncbi:MULTISPECIES: hypothetical protein [Burkholderia]|uniref:hypothetical protein n=1 Tax=Burkholderia TaxID=32008 RepID=UPI001F17EF1B|nr:MULTISPECIES: hypothetical protein [Burkholderia]